MTVINIRARKQLTRYTCGPASLRSIFYFYSHSVTEQELVEKGQIDEEGTDFKTMKMLARQYGYSFYSAHNGSLDILKKWLNCRVPILVCYQEGTPNGKNGHYAVIHGINSHFLFIADPSNYFVGDGNKFTLPRKITIRKFLQHWWEIDNGDKVKKWYAIIRPKHK